MQSMNRNYKQVKLGNYILRSVRLGKRNIRSRSVRLGKWNIRSRIVRLGRENVRYRSIRLGILSEQLEIQI